MNRSVNKYAQEEPKDVVVEQQPDYGDLLDFGVPNPEP